MTKKQELEVRAKLLALRASYEKRGPVIAYLKYQKLTSEEKQQLAVKWKNYYAGSTQSEQYKRFVTQKNALLAKDFVTVKRLADEARRELENQTIMTPTPSTYDPRFLSSSWDVLCYERVNQALEKNEAGNEAFDLFRG
jgi:hypothetical protein